MARAAAASPLVSPIIYVSVSPVCVSTEVHGPVTTQGEVDFEKQLLFSVTHVTAHGREETSVSTPRLSAALLHAWVFTMLRGTVMRTYVFHSTLYFTLPVVHIHILYIYIYFILISVVRHLYYTDTTCMLCAEPVAAVAFHGTLTICSLLPFVSCAAQQKYVPHYTKLSHINQPGCFILTLVRLLTQWRLGEFRLKQIDILI